MGAEATCTATFKGKRIKGKARLETETLEFRGPDVRLSIPFKHIRRVAARGGVLVVESDHGVLSLALGDTAAKWADKIEHPRSRLQKIGVKTAWRVSALGVEDMNFLAELEGSVAELSVGRTLKASDAIFVGASKTGELARLAKLVPALKPDGALWVIRPKGRAEITESAVRDAGRAAGLVDVKVVAFSPTHTAEKFVIHRKDRNSSYYRD